MNWGGGPAEIHEDLVNELFERLPPLSALAGWERDRLKEEAARIIESFYVDDDDACPD
jgi:hypothetical protein